MNLKNTAFAALVAVGVTTFAGQLKPKALVIMLDGMRADSVENTWAPNLRMLRDGAWQKIFTRRPEVFTAREKREWLDTMTDVTLGSDAFFPFSDNIERAYKSGVRYVAEPGGSVRDDAVIECCDKYGMTMVFTGIRLFHH